MHWCLFLMLAVANSCPSNDNLGCLLENQKYQDDLSGASRALLNHALHGPLTQSLFENPTDLLENMEISNCQAVQLTNYSDCTATLFNVRIQMVVLFIWMISNAFIGFRRRHPTRILVQVSAWKEIRSNFVKSTSSRSAFRNGEWHATK